MDKIKAAAHLLDKAGYTYTINDETIIVKDPVHGYRADGSYGVVDYNSVKIYTYRGSSILAVAVRFIDERS